MVSNLTIQSNKQELRDTFIVESKRNWTVVNESADVLNESPSVVDGVNVLARVQGPFFLVNGVSLNNRFYSKNLWEGAISKVQERLGKGGLFGAIGHDQPLDEKALAEGKFSHTVSKLWIDPATNEGMGEILVLGTEAGKQLNVLLRAGMPLPVSSRAYGKVSGKTAMGEDIIDADSFHLETFDFVLNPGVSSAYVSVVENVPPTQEEDSEMVDQKIEEKLELVQKLTEEKMGLNSKLNDVLTENIALNTKAADLEKSVQVLEAANAELLEGLRKWLELPVLKEYALAAGLLDQGAVVPNAGQFVKKMLGLTEAYAGLGSVEELKAVKEANAAFSALGSLEELNKMFGVFEQYLELGSVEELNKIMDVTESYVRLGKPEELATKLESGRKLAAQIQEGKRKAAATKIANEFGVSEEAVLEMVKKMGPEAAIDSLKKIKETAVLTSVYKIGSNKVDETVVKTPAASTLTSRFFESSVPRDSAPVADLATPRASL